MTSEEKGRVLITGGAGFIGSHLADRLLQGGYSVRALDALLPQVHEHGAPAYLNPAVDLQVGDCRDADTMRKALADVDVLVHFAAAVGVGQSMYEISHYCDINVMGTAALLETMAKGGPRPKRMIVASSMSIYGEGLYDCPSCGPQAPGPRPAAQLGSHEWALRCPKCGAAMEPRPTPESKPIIPTSIYAINKRDQEEMMLVMGRGLGIPTIALRFFNVYGTRQALSNPYTGVAAIFSSALLNKRSPVIFEDGQQLRDFVHVSDIAEGCLLAIEREDVSDDVFNIGTGQPTHLMTLLDLLRREIPDAAQIEPKVLGQFREGDIRACYADISKARRRLGFAPRVALEDGIQELAQWVASSTSADRSDQALAELHSHRLVR